MNIIKGYFFKKIILFFEKKLLDNFDVISTISFGMMKKIEKKISDKKKLFYFPNFIDSNEYKIQNLKKQYNPFFDELGLLGDPEIIMYSGTLNEKLSYKVLLDSILRLKKYKNILWIISGEGAKKNLLLKKLKDFDNVLFLSFQDKEKLSYWLNLADIHIIPQKLSVADLVLPSKLLGILSSGKPAVGFAKEESELGKILDKFGVRVNDEDSRLFSEAIINLLNDEELRKYLGNRGRKYVFDSFEKEIVFQNLYSKINKILEKRN